jgi:hypothetical protein
LDFGISSGYSFGIEEWGVKTPKTANLAPVGTVKAGTGTLPVCGGGLFLLVFHICSARDAARARHPRHLGAAPQPIT